MITPNFVQQVKLSIHQFEPEELSVKVIDRYVHIEGRHEEKNDKIGFFTRQFTRRYFLPDGVQPESIRCTFNVDTSLLTVNAPVVLKKPVKEYIIPIVVVGQQLSEQKLKKQQQKQEQQQQQPQPSTSSSARRHHHHHQNHNHHHHHHVYPHVPPPKEFIH